jgi:hypothetical protein
LGKRVVLVWFLMVILWWIAGENVVVATVVLALRICRFFENFLWKT